jgi:uncharacterized protein
MRLFIILKKGNKNEKMIKINRTIFLLLLSFYSITSFSQSYTEEILQFQEELNKAYLDPNKTPLTEEDLMVFTEHSFFPIDEKFRVEAKFIRTYNSPPFRMKTTTSRLPIYEKYGEAVFTIDSVEFRLPIYQSHQSRQSEEYKNHLFFPFTDLTNGDESYKGGRYIDLRIPSGDTIVIDFNKAYNPYCTYNAQYSCPIPPKENHIDIKITAGVSYRHHQ